ncbi:efflux RND transporter periplasmic adaptor subunit [Marinobacter halotolerans]|uniref:efflux RND transporter periplasmic adaptor subunit n=1 Tax=Marinobacter halotolerans TaxID=1569211 RepID=UPI0012441F27|nr:HlyD family efflux transporter periplasmic adaptor subunit [Marinobacter halotolerans]
MSPSKVSAGKRSMGKWLFWLLFGVLAIALMIGVLRPEPVWVDVAEARRGPIEVTIAEQGTTRVKDRFVVSSPVTGFLHRLEFQVGDEVIPGELLTHVNPMPSEMLDARSRAEAQARVAAVQSALNSARQKVSAARADAEFANSEYQRLQSLESSQFVSRERLDEIKTALTRARAILRSAVFEEEVASHELAGARTHLEVSAARAAGEKPAEQVALRSPVNGAVLGIMRKSEGIIQAGEAILELGDAGALEVVVDVLSSDAVRLTPGTLARLHGWGGSPLNAVVRRIEPVGFEDISALGVKEQRVQVILDLTSPRADWANLGDGYAVDAEFILWSSEDSLQIPASSLFVTDGASFVFVIEDDTAHVTPVETGRSNGLSTVILDGLDEGDKVVRHPSRELEDGDRIQVR